MGLAKKDDIEQRIHESYMPDYLSSVYRQMRYAFGDAWDQTATSVPGFDEGEFPYWPDIKPKYLAVGQSRRILNTTFITLSKVMYNEPEPEFPQLDAMDANARKGYIKARWNGWPIGDDRFGRQEEMAFIEGHAFGLGFLQYGLKKGPTGQQMLACRHSPTLMTLGDPTERDPSRWRRVTFVHYISKEEALKRWPRAVIEPYVKPLFDEVSGKPLEMVRLFEYYDMGIGGDDPTWAIVPGSWHNKPIEKGPNPFGCLPFSHYVHFFAPGMRTPVGAVVLQMATQEALNECEEYMRQNILAGKGFDIADISQFERADLEAIRAGRPTRVVRRTQPRQGAHDAWERVPAQDISTSAVNYFQHLERQFTTESGITDFDKGIQPEETRTLGENQMVAEQGQTQGSWSIRQTVQFRQRSFDTMVKIAKDFDREPVWVEFFDGKAFLNNPEAPESALDQVFQEPANAVVSEESLNYRDVEAKRSQRVAQLMAIFPQVQIGLFNPRWWGEEVLKAMGEKDLKVALNVGDEMGAEQAGMGLPMGPMGAGQAPPM